MGRETIKKNFLMMRFGRNMGNFPVVIKVWENNQEKIYPFHDVYFDEQENNFVVKAKTWDDKSIAEE